MKKAQNRLLLRLSLSIAVCVITLSVVGNFVQYEVVQGRFGTSFDAGQEAIAAITKKATALAEQTAISNAKGTVDILTQIAPAAIAAFDLSSLDQYARTATQNEDVAVVEYRTADGDVMASAKAREPAKRGDAVIVRDIISEGSKLGSVSVALTFHSLNKVQAEIDAITAQRVAAMKQGFDEAIYNLALGFIIAAAASAVVLFTAPYLLMRRSVFVPLGRLQNAMIRLAGGELDCTVPATERKDEIGEMAGAVQVFKDNAIRTKTLEAEQVEQKRRAEEERRAAMLQLAKQFEESIGGVIQTVTGAVSELQESSEEMASTANETSAQATTVASAAEQASANVQTVASAAEELSGSIGEISRQVAQASEIASAAVKEAEQTNVKVQGLAQAANKIGEVVALITDIAEQTNLLALNATIEAARAGDAGKGFAVVASEVKNLANQTAKATDEIGAQISGIQSATREAVAAIESITKTISQINEVNSGVASAVEEQGAATQEIARNVEQAAAGTHEVSSNIVSVNQAANETGAAADKIRNSSMELAQQADILQTEVGKFLVQVRAERSEMKLLEWNDDLVCGIPDIDRDHRRLVDMANEAYGLLMTGEGIAATGSLVKDLGGVVVQHFADEERAMNRIGYPDLAQHKKLHRDLVEKFEGLRKRLEGGDKGAGKDLFVYLAEWLKDHTFNQDRAFIAYARNRGKEKLLRAA